MMQLLQQKLFFLLIFVPNIVHGVVVMPLHYLMQQFPEIKYQKVFDQIPFQYQCFELVPTAKSDGNFLETFVLTLPNACVQSTQGHVFLNDYFIQELIWADQSQNIQFLQRVADHQVMKVSGTVAVIANMANTNYYHWTCEVLGRLALLEMSGIAYDWLYVPYSKPFMVEMLQLWGIDFEKLILADDHMCIQAEKLIVPSYTINTDLGFKTRVGSCMHPKAAEYVRNKLLMAVEKQESNCHFSKKIFISRNDAPVRRILNEDEFFAVLQEHGFERYELAKLSVADQIRLFHNAEIIIAPHGAGLINTMFCQPGTKVLEIFQELIDNTYWYITQLFDLQYHPIQTVDFKQECFLDWPNHLSEYSVAWKSDTTISQETINQILQLL